MRDWSDTGAGPSQRDEWTFLVLRALAMIGGMVALFLVPLRPEHQPHLAPFAWAFVGYEGALFLAIWAWPHALRGLLIASLGSDLVFVALFVWHTGGAESHFYLLFYLLVALGAAHFSPGIGLLTAGGASLAYVLASTPVSAPVEWQHLGARVATLFLLSGALGYLSQRERMARARAEILNVELQEHQARLERAHSELRASQERLAQAERLAIVGQMSAKVSHEVRNPLGSISLNAELLDDELQALPADRRREASRLLSAIQLQVDELTKVTEAYLRFARLPKPRPQLTRAESLLEGLADFVRPELNASRIALRLHVPPDLPPLDVDPGQIRQALLNLIRNAVEAMPGGGVLSLTAAARDSADGAEVEIAVEDSGVGMRREDAERIFEPFFTTKEGGTGLGLAVARQIAVDHGGRLACEPAREQGAVFRLILPARGAMP